MRVAVAGGAGFIGRVMCSKLLDRGDEVVCIDNLVTGTGEHVKELSERAGFSFVEADISQGVDVQGVGVQGVGVQGVAVQGADVQGVDAHGVDAHGVDAPGVDSGGRLNAVVNLACPASPADFGPLSLEILSAGSTGVANLLELARRHHARFLQASTSEVYGDPLVHPQPESYWGNVNPIGQRSVYDEAKRFGEALTMAFHRRYGLEVRIARIFNTYGPGMRLDDGRVVSNFVTQALRGLPLTVYGDGSQTRSLCYVDDEVDGLIALLGSSYTGPVNVGNEDERTIQEIAELVIELTGSGSEIAYMALPADDPAQRRPDLTVARREIGWEPVTSLRDGLRSTIDWFRSRLDASDSP